MGSCGGNTCSQGGSYYSMSFGAKHSEKRYFKNHIVHNDSKGRYIKIKTLKGTIKKYLPKGSRTTKHKITTHSPYKPVKNKNKIIGIRLSARAVFDKHGYKAVGKKYPVLQKDGNIKYKTLKIRKNGSPYFSNNFGMQKSFVRVRPTHVTTELNKNWLRGPQYSDMTGLKNSWPATYLNKTEVRFQAPKNGLLPPAGVPQPLPTSLLPRYITSTGINRHRPHMHFGKMCFGS